MINNEDIKFFFHASPASISIVNSSLSRAGTKCTEVRRRIGTTDDQLLFLSQTDLEMTNSVGPYLRKNGFSSSKPGYPHTIVSPVELSQSQRHVPFRGNSSHPKQSKGLMIKRLLSRTAFALVTLTLFQNPALAKATQAQGTAEHLHTGQKIANFFMGFGLPRWAVLATISAMPVVELRGAVPVGVWLGMPITHVLPICVLGNMAPIVPMMYLLRNERLK